MKKNFYSYTRPRWVWMTVLWVFCCLFSNMAMSQDIYTWNRSSSKNWSTSSNWTKTGTAVRDTSPLQDSGRQLEINEQSSVTNFYLCNKFQIKFN